MEMAYFLKYEENELKKLNGLTTAKEITQQPKLWLETLDIIEKNKDRIMNFFKALKDDEIERIIFTGAGTSAFIGECVAPYLQGILNQRVEAIATTDIVSNPEVYLQKHKKTLLVSCARSGNSPESIGTFDLAEQLVENIYHIVLTCDENGKLAQKSKENPRCLLILMPENANDQGFAMTGSFTTMLMASILIFNMDSINSISKKIDMISKNGMNILDKTVDTIKNLAEVDIERVIFLGASSLKALCRESSLKVLELTRGRVVSDYNSPLGFRHGPKSIINDKTLIFLYLSNDQYTRKYDIDLLREMKQEGGNKKVVAISAYEYEEMSELVDYYITLENMSLGSYEDIFLSFSYILIAQSYSFFKSINLGISPDNPSPDGVVNRVVKGVSIYPYK